MMFRNMIRGWFSGEDVPYNGFIKALLLGDAEAMNEYMNEIALTTFGSFDIAGSAARNEVLSELGVRVEPLFKVEPLISLDIFKDNRQNKRRNKGKDMQRRCLTY